VVGELSNKKVLVLIFLRVGDGGGAGGNENQ